MYSEQALREGLRTKRFGNKIYTFDTIDSTNNCARALAGCWAEEGTVIIAEQQTAGRGRLGRPWVANPNENLTFSVILRPGLLPDQLNIIPLYVAVAVTQAVQNVTGLSVECKWPNDLLIKGRKFGGILIEGSVKQNAVEYVVVGIGVNVNQERFAGELAKTATSLRLEKRNKIDRQKLFREILNLMESHYTAAASSNFQSILPLWRSYTSMIDKQISVMERGAVVSGIVKGFTSEGGLVLQADGKERTFYAGDVTVIGS
jgi:BirA family biotin operon repressor/biotin-[acetyl-CoA-carboxylase] ligase